MTRVTLPDAFLSTPLAHRALHDRVRNRPENSRAAVRAAISAGYGIEIDLQLSSDGQAMVFHDYGLERLTAERGPVRLRCCEDLQQITLVDSEEGIPTFAEVLRIVDGQVPLVVELKDQDGALGSNTVQLERAAADAAGGYAGPLAFMSFNPHSMIELSRIAPEVPRGLTTCAENSVDWPPSSRETRRRLSEIPDLDATGASFVSHEEASLHLPRIAEIRALGFPVLCWTIRSAESERAARRYADNITFEGYLPT